MAKKISIVAPGTERMYTIPLRKQVLKQPRAQKANRAVKTIQQFLVRHMKADIVKVSPMVNDTIWKRGVHTPPSKIRVKATKDDKGVVTARLPDEKIEVPKKAEKKSKLDALKEATATKGTGDGKSKISEAVQKGLEAGEASKPKKIEKEEPKATTEKPAAEEKKAEK